MAVRDVIIHGVSDSPIWGQVPSAPLKVTSIAKDASATVSWYAPASSGSSGITQYVVTPYVGATPGTPKTVAVGSVTSLSDSYGGTALQTDVTGLTNSTAYTFTVKAVNSYGTGVESVASGANTPLAGLVFGDDFNGPAGAAPDPEWWVYDRVAYLAQNEVAYYKPDHCVLDGAGSLKLTAEKISQSGPRYPSDPLYPGTVTQPWTSGACQSNSKLWYPTAGTSMTYEVKQQVDPNAGSGYWPGLFWLEGQDYIQAWKTDPNQAGWNDTTRAEIDVAEWNETGSPNSYGSVSWASSSAQITNLTSTTLATQQHVYSCTWTPGVSCVFKRDGATTATHTAQVPSQGAQFFLMLYLQIKNTITLSATESCYIDYVRVYQN